MKYGEEIGRSGKVTGSVDDDVRRQNVPGGRKE